MKRIGVAIAMLAACAAQPALAQARGDGAAVEKAVRAIYAGYGNPDAATAGDEPVLTPRLKAMMNECTALQEKIDVDEGADSTFGNCSEDYDVFCQCQDTSGTDWAKMAIRTRFPAGGRAEADLSFDSEPGPDLKLLLVKAPSGWLVDDFWEYNREGDGPGEASYGGRLIKSIGAMRKQLKLPPWKAPAN